MQTKRGSHARTRTLAKVQRNVLFHHMTPDRFRVVTKHQIPPPKQMALTFPPHYYNAATLGASSVYPGRGQRMWRGVGSHHITCIDRCTQLSHFPAPVLKELSLLCISPNIYWWLNMTGWSTTRGKPWVGERTSQELLINSIGNLKHGENWLIDRLPHNQNSNCLG